VAAREELIVLDNLIRTATGTARSVVGTAAGLVTRAASSIVGRIPGRRPSANETLKPVPVGLLDADDLPVANWDQLTTDAIGQAVKDLPRDHLSALKRYELAHSARPAVLAILDERLGN
jgi:hypothetical protein